MQREPSTEMCQYAQSVATAPLADLGARIDDAFDSLPMPVTVIQVKVKPGGRASALTPAGDGTWLARLKSPPVEGKANAELVALVARQFMCPKSAVSIKAGASARTKLLVISTA